MTDSSVPHTDLERFAAEHAVLLARLLEQTAGDAPDGQVLRRCEQLVLDQGRLLLRQLLAASLQQQIDQDQKKTLPFAPAAVEHAVGTKATTPKR